MKRLPLALIVFGLLHAAFFGDVIFGDRTLSASAYVAGLTGPAVVPEGPHLLDVEGAAWVDEPSPHLAASAFAVGELPLWSPASGLGAPLAANLNSGAGNPLQLPLNLAPTPWRADLFYLGRLLLLAIFSFVMLSELGLASVAAFVGAAVATYGGYAMAWIAHHPLSSEIFLPLLLLGFERGRRGNRDGWVLVVLGAAGSLAGGKLQASLLCFGFTIAWASLRASHAQGGRGIATGVAAGGGLALGVAMAAFLLVPAAELMARASGLTLGGRTQLAGYTVPLPSLASLAVPALFVAPGQVLPGGFLTPAVGIGAVVLAGVGVMARGSPLVALARFCLVWAGALLLRNVGALGDLATRLPAVRGILFVKYTFTIVFALAVAAAIGLDAILAGRIEAKRARRTILCALLAVAMVALGAVVSRALPTFPMHTSGSLAFLAGFTLTTVLWAARWLTRGHVAVLFGLLVATELWSFAPHHHPPRRDPYRAPAFVEFLRDAPSGRVIADPDLLVPLTSAAAGLRDVRAIDVLTPGAYYAFFTRLVSFCDRVIHFTVDPDIVLAATAPALDLAGVRYVVSRQALPADDLAWRVRRQVGRERTARLLADLVRLRTEGGPLAIGPVRSGDDERFAFTLPTPFVLEVAAESEAAELAWGVLVRGEASGIGLRVVVDGLSSDAPTTPSTIPSAAEWHEHRIALAQAGARRRVRLRLIGTSVDGRPAMVSIGNLGFDGGVATEARLVSERGARHAAEAAHLTPVFRDVEESVVVYENTNALPRVFRVGRVEPSPSEEAAFTRLGDGFDFRHVVLVRTQDVRSVQAALGEGVPAGDAGNLGTAEIREETPNAVVVATTGATPAVLVLADLAFPGWRAEVDGRSVPVLTVDGLLRGVVVPAGAHVVTFRYLPTSLLIGVLLSGLGLVALVPYVRHAARVHVDGTVA